MRGFQPRQVELDEMLDLAGMTWQCMVCKDMRLDAAITVTKVNIDSDERSFPYVFNLRHCVDRMGCVQTANRMAAGDYLIEELP